MNKRQLCCCKNLAREALSCVYENNFLAKKQAQNKLKLLIEKINEEIKNIEKLENRMNI